MDEPRTEELAALEPSTAEGRDMLAHSVQYVPADADRAVVAAKIIAIENEVRAAARHERRREPLHVQPFLSDSGTELAALKVLRLTGEQLDGLGHGLTGYPTADDFAVDWDEYEEFVRLDDVRELVRAASRPAVGDGLLREALWSACPHVGKYGDDGEMQCQGQDFRRDNLDGLSRHVIMAASRPAVRDGLREALTWALERLAPYSHPDECSPMECRCGYWEARAALADKGSREAGEA